MGGLDQPDDPPPQHAAARAEGSRGRARLSGSRLSAARAGGPPGLAESVFEAVRSYCRPRRRGSRAASIQSRRLGVAARNTLLVPQKLRLISACANSAAVFGSLPAATRVSLSSAQ